MRTAAATTTGWIGPFALHEELGEGGMGIVYAATDRRTGRKVAIKFLKPREVNCLASVERLRREGRAVASLNHPNVATLYELNEESGQPFLVLEHLPGGTLAAKIRTGHENAALLPLSKAIEYAIQAAEGLEHAHRHGVLHLDVKTGNMMLTRDDKVKLTDFSLAKIPGVQADATAREIRGTVPYLSPEQVLGGTIDHRSDIFSFGVVLFELLTGRLPFSGATEVETMAQIVRGPAPRLRRFRPGMPDRLQAILDRALAKKPADRYQTMQELLSDLRRLEEGIRAAELQRTILVTRPPPSPSVWPILLAFVVFVGAFLLFAPRPPLRPVLEEIRHWFPARESPVARLVVLPCRNNAGVADDALCAGMLDILTTRLTQLEQFNPRLRLLSPAEVAARNVSDPNEARRAMGANFAVEVSLSRLGDRLLLAVNLIDTASGEILGGRTLEQHRAELARLNNLLVYSVTGLLRLQLQEPARTLVEAGGSRNKEAFSRYVIALGELRRYDQPERVVRAAELLDDAVRLDPQFALAHAGLAESFLLRYDRLREPRLLDEGLACCVRALQLSPELAAVHSTMGLIQTRRGQYEAAIGSFEKALALAPVSAGVHRGLAAVYEAQRNGEMAEATYKNAVLLRPDAWDSHNDLGRFYFNRGRYRNAAEEFQRVVSLIPDSARGYTNLGAALVQIGDYPRAAAMFEQAIRLQPAPRAWSNLGTLHYFREEFAEAARSFEQAVALSPQDYAYWGYLADALRWVPGRTAASRFALEKAIGLARKELATNPKNARARSHLAMFLVSTGRRSRAVLEIRDALAAAPNDNLVLFHAALVYEQAGHRIEALRRLKAALAAGHPIEAVRKGAPPLKALRQDPRYRTLEAEFAKPIPGAEGD